MINRITSSSVNKTLSTNIGNHYSKYATLTQQIGSGKKINSILDDPIQSVNIVNSNRQLNRIGIWTGNVKSIMNEVKESSETLELAITKTQRAKDLAASAANGITSKAGLEATLSELDRIIETTVSLANTNYNGSYIYSGANTKTPPYEIEYGIDADGNQTKEIIGVKYTGTPITGQWERKLEIVNGEFERINVTGLEAFGDYDCEPVLDINGDPVLDADGNPTYTVNSQSGVFKDLIDFRNALKETLNAVIEQENLPSNATEADKAAAGSRVSAGYASINDTLDGFTSSLNNLTVINSTFGSLTNKMEMTSETLKNSENNLVEHVSNLQELDLTQAIGDWYSAQYALQASMQATTSIMSMSLLNYIS